MDRVSSLLTREMDFKSLLQANDITVPVQRHLSRTYAALAATVACSAVGAWVHLQTNMGGLLSMLGAMGLLLSLAASHGTDKADSPKRMAMLAGFGALKGLSLGGLIEQLLFLDPSIVPTAFLGTVLVFASFSAAALFSRRRSLLYLGGLLSTAISVMTLFSFISLFYRTEAMFLFNLYGGLLVFVGYVVFDTQLIIESASRGDSDFLWHAAQLFIDFVGTFVRLAIILSRKEKDRRRK